MLLNHLRLIICLTILKILLSSLLRGVSLTLILSCYSSLLTIILMMSISYWSTLFLPNPLLTIWLYYSILLG